MKNQIKGREFWRRRKKRAYIIGEICKVTARKGS